MAFGKQKSSKVVNLSSKMDNLANPETLNISPDSTNEEGFTWSYLENADLFNSRQTNLRNGSLDICGGIANDLTSLPQQYISVTGLLATGVKNLGFYDWFYFDSNQSENILIKPGILINSSGTLNLFGGTVTLKEHETPFNYANLVKANQISNDIGLSAYVYNLTTDPAFPREVYSSSGSFSGTAPSWDDFGIKHNISLTGNWYTQPKKPFLETSPLSRSYDIFNLGTISGISGYYESNETQVNFNFFPPVTMGSGVYFIKFDIVNSGSVPKNFALKYVIDSGYDYQPNAILAASSGFQGTTYLIPSGSIKSLPLLKLNAYSKSPYVVTENGPSNFSYPGQLANLPASAYLQNAPYASSNLLSTFNPAIGNSPVSTKTVEFGEAINLTGYTSLNGTYVYAGIAGTGIAPYQTIFSSMQPFSSGGEKITFNNYTLPYLCNISLITSGIGLLNGSIGSYSIQSRQILYSFSGYHTFSQAKNDFLGDQITDTFNGDQVKNTYNHLDKIYSIFTSPIVLPSGQYLFSWQFLNNDGSSTTLSDFYYCNRVNAGGVELRSPIEIGVSASNAYTNGCYVTNLSGDATVFCTNPITLTGPDPYENNPVYQGMDYDLVFGLLSFPSGNAIQGIYDYRIAPTNTQVIVYGQGKKLNYFTLANPNKINHKTIYSGTAAANNHNLWQFTTFDDLLLGTNYSVNPPQIWDQINSGTRNLGYQPTFSLAEVSGVVNNPTSSTFTSGQTYSILLATNLNSGGYRASNLQTITLSGTSLSGCPVVLVSGLNIANQFGFDIPLNSTYVFSTLNSGSALYLVDLYSGATRNSTRIPNPFPNTISTAYICQLDTAPANGQVVNVLQDFDQQYLTTQVPTPFGKQILVYNNYVCQIGDPAFPSRIWYSQEFGPQIWGTDGRFDGFVDVDSDNRQFLTSWGTFKQFLFLFKQNSTYRLEATGDSNNPFDIVQISSSIGTVGGFSTVSTDFGIFGISEYGIFKADYYGVSIISDPILPFFETLTETDLTFAVGVHDQLSKTIVWSITSDQANSLSDFGIVYNYKDNAFSVRRGGMFNTAARIGDANDFSILLAGDVLGQISEINVADTFTDTGFSDGVTSPLTFPVTITSKSPWLSLGNSSNLYQLKRIHFNIDAAPNTTLRLDIYIDGNEGAIQYSRYIDLSSNSPNKHINLNKTCRTVKFVLTNTGSLNPIHIKSFQMDVIALGQNIPG